MKFLYNLKCLYPTENFWGSSSSSPDIQKIKRENEDMEQTIRLFRSIFHQNAFTEVLVATMVLGGDPRRSSRQTGFPMRLMGK
ncbi:hypothetical protein CEXT_295181 [Caerostris extrusa]|uniref:Uncharacterized protein n=1 Tax=Caerostris extrusa TaxID=172846 RepID=A0AAV4M974_CAEEX|nr:hypothetical protein CEXT_295181 [Caerostris extrusa]